jgi:putative ABC transport system permease protein
MITRLPGVTAVQDTGAVHGISVYKSPYIPSIETNALSVDAATLGLPAVAGTSLAQGRFLDAATAREPVAVLGAAAARLILQQYLDDLAGRGHAGSDPSTHPEEPA